MAKVKWIGAKSKHAGKNLLKSKYASPTSISPKKSAKKQEHSKTRINIDC